MLHPNTQPASAAQITDDIAHAMIDANAHGGATRQALIAMGIKPDDLETYGDAARLRANALFQRRTERPAYDRPARVGQAAEQIGNLLPGLPLIVLHLMSRGFPKSELDDILTEAVASAAATFAREGNAK